MVVPIDLKNLSPKGASGIPLKQFALAGPKVRPDTLQVKFSLLQNKFHCDTVHVDYICLL
jgi:hypothetical protein